MMTAQQQLLSIVRNTLRRFGFEVYRLKGPSVLNSIIKALANKVRAEFLRNGFGFDDAWIERLEDEIRFWLFYFATNASEYGGVAEIQFMSHPRTFQYSNLFTDRLERTALNVLDVGAGPISVVGTLDDNRIINLIAIDPLAPAYKEILSLYAIKQPIPTTFGVAESLRNQFIKESFDLVHACNSLDHSFDPFSAIHQMAELVHVDGWLILDHADREADNQSFQGLHQWNFFVSDGCYRIESSTGQIRSIDHERLGFTMKCEQYMAFGKVHSRILYQRIKLN